MRNNYNNSTKNNYRRTVSGNKDDRTAKANDWLVELIKKYKDPVQYAVDHTMSVKCRNGVSEIIKGNLKEIPIFEINMPDTITRIFKNDVVTCARAAVTHAAQGDRVCVLNYASYTSPGGGFLKGSTAQEESLCFSTGLYYCLVDHMDWYNMHKEERHDFVYSDDYIYSKDVPFIINGKIYKIDVLTMAAPNYARAAVPVNDAMEQRMRAAYELPAKYGANILLLGAWGCGVFGNETDFVAGMWKSLSEEHNGWYKEIVHPIIDNENYKTFRKVYGI